MLLPESLALERSSPYSNRFLTNVLRNLTSAFSRLTQASEAQTAALADLKEDLLLQDDTPDEEQNIDKQPDSGYITTVVNNCTLDLSKKNVVSDGRSDSEAQSPNDIVESRPRVINLTQKNPQRSRVKLQSSSTLCLRVASRPTRLKRAPKNTRQYQVPERLECK